MALQGSNEAPSRRFIRAYLVIWAVGAVGALGYLTSLAWQAEQPLQMPSRPKVVEPDQGLSAAAKALAEVGTVRQTVDGLTKNLGDLKDTVEQRGDQDKTMQARLAALEEKVASIPSGGGPVTSGTMPAAKQKIAEKPAEKVAEKAPAKAVTTKSVQQKSGTRVITITEDPDGKSPIETGSIPQPQMGFGEIVVTKAGETFAVQLDVAPSVDVLRQRWDLLLERHGAALAALQPRIVAPRTQGAPYRLVAGPVSSAADAKLICNELRAQLPACSTTDFIGEPL